MFKKFVIKFTLKHGSPNVMYHKAHRLLEFSYSTDHLEEATRYDKVEMDSFFDRVFCNEQWTKSILEL